MISIDGVQSAKALLGNEYRAIKRSPINDEGPDLFEDNNPAAIADVVKVLRSPVENPGDEEEASLVTEQLFSSAEIEITPSFTSTVGVEEYRTKRSFGLDPEAGVWR